MSDEPETPPPEGGAPSAGTPKAVLGLLAANLLVSGAVLARTLTAASAHPAPAAHVEAAPSNVIKGPVVVLDPFVVNLNEPGSTRYLKVQLQVEMRDGAAVKVLEQSKQLVRDDILSYLSGLRVDDTLGPEKKTQIRDELATKVGERIGRDRVTRMIFAEFVIQ